MSAQSGGEGPKCVSLTELTPADEPKPSKGAGGGRTLKVEALP